MQIKGSKYTIFGTHQCLNHLGMGLKGSSITDSSLGHNNCNDQENK
jgi:hypothetical protein